ncbi:MAG: hypothetical protein AAF647_00145 [Pseudomonadota bacterium]
MTRAAPAIPAATPAARPTSTPASPPVSRDMAALAHALILGRRASPAELDACQASGIDRQGLRAALLGSAEFQAQLAHQSAPADAETAAPAPTKPAPTPDTITPDTITPDAPLLFLHIPKTAGTTLGQLLKTAHPEAAWLDGLAVARRLRAMAPEARARLDIIQGHVPHQTGELIAGPKRYLTVLRMPGPRLLSYYNYIARAPDHPDHARARALSFGAYLEASLESPLRPWLDNTQMRLIAGRDGPEWIGAEARLLEHAIAHIAAPDMRFGFSETFDAFQAELVAEGLLPAVSGTRHNAAPFPADLEEALAALTAPQRAIFDAYIRWDSWFYDIAFRIKGARNACL